MLYLRVLSALVGIPIIVLSVYMGGPWYALLLLLVSNIGLYEYNGIMHDQGYRVHAFFNHFGASAIIVTIFLDQQALVGPLILLFFFALFVSTLFAMNRPSVVEAALSLWAIVYLGAMLGYLLMLRMLPDGAVYTYLLLGGVWLHDTLAYFIGVRWGSHRFAPEISPKKSLEGSLAGLLGTVIVFFAAAWFFPEQVPLSPLQAAIFGTGLAVFSQLGDLLESALKRQLKVKDSGGLIPGHGGILDRFDSLVITGPFVYYFFLLLGSING